MSDIAPTWSRPRPTRETRPDIQLPDGEILKPRARFAADDLDVCDKSAARMNLPTTYIGGVAYVAYKASLTIIAERVHRPNQPPRRGRGR